MDKLRRLKEAMHLASKEVRVEVRREADEKVQEEFRLQTAIAALQVLLSLDSFVFFHTKFKSF